MCVGPWRLTRPILPANLSLPRNTQVLGPPAISLSYTHLLPPLLPCGSSSLTPDSSLNPPPILSTGPPGSFAPWWIIPSVCSESSGQLTLTEVWLSPDYPGFPRFHISSLGLVTQHYTSTPWSLAIHYSSSFWKICPLCRVLDSLSFLSPSFLPCCPLFDLLMTALSTSAIQSRHQ